MGELVGMNLGLDLAVSLVQPFAVDPEGRRQAEQLEMVFAEVEVHNELSVVSFSCQVARLAQLTLIADH